MLLREAGSVIGGVGFHPERVGGEIGGVRFHQNAFRMKSEGSDSTKNRLG